MTSYIQDLYDDYAYEELEKMRDSEQFFQEVFEEKPCKIKLTNIQLGKEK